MHTIEACHDFDAPADALWALLADFGNIERWWPQDNDDVRIARVELTGQGVGLTRHIYTAGMPDPISERLDALNAFKRTFTLSIVSVPPAGMKWYQATGRVVELSGQRCRLDYHAEFNITDSGSADEARAFLNLVYGLMFEGLGATLAREKCLN